MVKTLERALQEVANLPEAAQEKIGQELLAHLAKLRSLREDIDDGIASLEAGEGRHLDIEDVIARKRHGRT